MLKQKWCWLCWEKEKQDGAKTVCVLYIESERQRQRQWQRQWQRVCVMLALIRYDDAFKPVEHQGMRRANLTGIALPNTLGCQINSLLSLTFSLSHNSVSSSSSSSLVEKVEYLVHRKKNIERHWESTNWPIEPAIGGGLMNDWLTDRANGDAPMINATSCRDSWAFIYWAGCGCCCRCWNNYSWNKSRKKVAKIAATKTKHQQPKW